MSPCVICVVIAREIFLLQSYCPEITKCITNLKTIINNNKFITYSAQISI